MHLIEFKTKSQNKEDKKMATSRKLVLTLLVVILTFLFSACSHVMIPRGPIPVKMDVVGALNANKAISLQNDVPDSKLTIIASQGFHKYYADYRVWTSFIVNQLETELRSRGVQVSPDGQDVFKVRVEQAGLYWGSFSTRCVINVRVEKKDGTWSKSFEGNNASPMSLYRAIDGSVYKAVVAILQDREFMNTLSK
jgi:uncharacterized lipoprotein YajG